MFDYKFVKIYSKVLSVTYILNNFQFLLDIFIYALSLKSGGFPGV
jgi:hypothetical protein